MVNAEAESAKTLGNEAYKKKEFPEALEQYDKAIELDPTNIVYRTNKAAVYHELKKYDECIELCKEAIAVGRENRAEYISIGKAYERIGRCFEKMENLEEAISNYELSLAEYRKRELDQKVKELRKILEERKRKAYIDPKIAEEEKIKGNEFFIKGQFADALACYTEAIKRNPDEACFYSNRAACYTKLLEFTSALSDCDACIARDPKFIKAYLRKGAIFRSMKDLNQARKAFQDALQLDKNCHEALQGLRSTFSGDEDPEDSRNKALNDPEIAQILSDPAMRHILQQMNDPEAQRELLKNPEIVSKIMKLNRAGLIAFK